MKRSAPLFATLLLALVTLSACPVGNSDSAQKPVDHCTTAGVRCNLDGGQLGVCSANTDGTFVCASQH
jgi:hypothetical protein